MALRWIPLLITVGLVGCVATGPNPASTSGDFAQRCEYLFAAIDKALDRSGVRDGAAAPVEGFPYLRVDRFLASYRAEPMSREGQAWWVGRMRTLDRDAREIELSNLPLSRRRELASGLLDAGDPMPGLERCGEAMMLRDLDDVEAMVRLRAAARVPDDYQTWKRVVGLYPLTSLAFYRGVMAYQSDTRETFDTPLSALAVGDRLVSYEPGAGNWGNAGSAAAVFARLRDNPFGVPLPEGKDLIGLLSAHAPIFEVEEVDRNDRIGAPVLNAEGAVRVDTSDRQLFARIAHVRYGDEALLQLVYSVWFPERPKQGRLDLLGGRLDGITWRVTLDADGEPLVYDTMHNCGCYHMFFPTPGVRMRPRGPVVEEPPLVPARLGPRPNNARIVLRIASGTHYVQNVRYHSQAVAGEHRKYDLAPAAQLRSIAWPGDGRRSLYRPDGIVSGTERGERYLLWPMGVREPGAMRQWGRHATAFVGRRHFDDPNLIERYFKIDRRLH